MHPRDDDMPSQDHEHPPAATSTYLCDDGNAEVEIGAESAEEAAQMYVDGGDWGEGPSWVTVYVQEIDEETREEIGDRDSYTVAIEQTVPDCDEAEHDRQSPIGIVGGIRENPGVWGHGGGVIIEEVCVVCGCARTTDTWAQDMQTGEQGLTSISYEPGKYDIGEYLNGLDVGGLDQSDNRDGEGWSTFVAEGPWGWWAAVTEGDDGSPPEAEWYHSEDEARAQSKVDAANLTENAAERASLSAGEDE